MRTDTYAVLWVRSAELTGSELQRLLDVPNGMSWNAGERRSIGSEAGIVEKRNGWLLESGCERSMAAAQHIHAIVASMRSVLPALHSLRDVCEIFLCCTVCAQRMPLLLFPSDVIAEIAELGVDFEIDVNIWEELGDEEVG